MNAFVRGALRVPARAASVAVVGLLAGSGALAHASAVTPLTLTDLRAVVEVADPQFGACGKRIAFVTRSADFAADTMLSTIRVIDVASGVTTVVTRPGDEALMPRWSPDGSTLAFLAKASTNGTNGSDEAQIAVISARSLVPVFVTHEPRGVNAFAWRPDGRGFAFTTADEAPNKKAIDAHDDAFEVGDNQWNARAAPLPNHLWSIARSGGRARRITHGAFSLDGEPRFTADGRGVLIGRYPTAYTQHYASSRLVRVDVRTGAITSVVAGGPADGRFSRDGKRLVYLAANPRSFSVQDAFVADPDGSRAVDLTARIDRGAQAAAFDADDRSLLVTVKSGTRMQLLRVAHATVTPLGLGDRNIEDFDVDCHGAVAFTAPTPASPGELYLRAPGGAIRALTHFNTAIARRARARVTTVTWRARDGATADGVVTIPAEPPAGKRAPLVLVIHGGPTYASLESFSDLAQLLAARGFYVFEPNYRGSDNLGPAFAQQTVPHITSMPGNDIEDGLAVVLKAFPIDPTRIGVSGWSEGGLLTSWLITHDTRWKAAMSGAAVNDWLMYRDLTDAQDFTPEFIGATSPWIDPQMRALYRAESPLTYAANVRTPTLIMTDAGDQRVPTPLAYAFYHAVRATGTPVTLVVIPADGHFPRDPVRSEEVVRRWVGWFADRL